MVQGKSCQYNRSTSQRLLVQIQESVFENGEWASDTLAKNNYTYDVTIPKNIKSGSYLLRHENLALHGGASLGGAQFYPGK